MNTLLVQPLPIKSISGQKPKWLRPQNALVNDRD
ncbi:hypothetical protein pb186bvf_002691 [Paramecium bursaria]